MPNLDYDQLILAATLQSINEHTSDSTIVVTQIYLPTYIYHFKEQNKTYDV